MVMVTLPAAGMAPFQVTVLVPTVATRCRRWRVALTRVRLAGRVSVNSLPGLSGGAAAPLLESTIGVGDRAADA